MMITRVQTATQAQQFLRIPEQLHGNHPDWICPLDAEIEAVFDPARNYYFNHGKAERWLLLNDRQEPAGRVAAFINYNTANGFEQPTGGMGFFDCPDNQEMANLLFFTAQEWLRENGMEAMDGPINFGENFSWWGLQTAGRRTPLFGNNFTPPYYYRLFKNYGFEIYFEQFYYELDLQKPGLLERMRPLRQRLEGTGHFSARHANLRNKAAIARDFCAVYNKAWTIHQNAMPITESRISAIIEKMAPVIDQDIIWFAYHDDDPIGVFIMLPDLNQILKKINKGRLNWLDKLRFQYFKMTGTCRRMYGFVFGVVPEFQNRGVEALMICAAGDHLLPKNRYDFLELAWIGDFNPRMLRLMDALGVEQIKTYATLRKLFDGKHPYHRSDLIGAGAEAVAKRLPIHKMEI